MTPSSCWRAVLLTAFLFLACSAGGSGSAPNTTPSVGAAGSGGQRMTGGAAGEAGNGGEPLDPIPHVPQPSQLCAAMGGVKGLRILTRGDGALATARDPLNGFKFDYFGRKGSLIYNLLTDPCINNHFAALLEPRRAEDLEHFAQCLSVFMASAAQCSLYDGESDDAGRPCLSLREAHAGKNISEADFMAFYIDVALAIDSGPADITQDVAAGFVLKMFGSDEVKGDVVTNQQLLGNSDPTLSCNLQGNGGSYAAGGGPPGFGGESDFGGESGNGGVP